MTTRLRTANESLITGCVDPELKKLLDLQELSDPAMRCLCPLARAAWHLHPRGSVDQATAEAALKTSYLISGDDIESSLQTGESPVG
jgi:hypothetical protein